MSLLRLDKSRNDRSERPAGKALDLGCAAGRASFELARHFAQVTGIDFSTHFIRLGVQLAETGRLRYTLVEEGELVAYKERSLAELGLDRFAKKVEFFQGDACNLKPVFTGYDLILAANLIDRLYSPARFLETVHERLNPGGLLLIASPYTWLAEHTKREEWIGGFKKDGENFTTLWSRWPILQALPTFNPALAVCAEIASPAGPLIVFGTIITYANDPGPLKTARRWEEHRKSIDAHAADWQALRQRFPDHHFCVAGDIISRKCTVPHLYRLELFGTPEDVARVSDGLERWWTQQ